MYLKNRKQIGAIIAFAIFVTGGIAATNHPKGPHKNLQILPKDISDEKLDSIMESYNKALGVDCKFCHVKVTDFPDSLDYAADQNPMKDNARAMMKMTIELNKNYFYFDKNERPEYLKVIQCLMCHRGVAYPLESH